MAEFVHGDDPKDHSVAEINEYLARDGVEAEEKQRVLDAEAGGQNRSTVNRPAAPDAGNAAPLSDQTNGLGDQPNGGGNPDPAGTAPEADAVGDAEPVESAYPTATSKPYWYEETQGPAPANADEQYTVVRVQRV